VDKPLVLLADDNEATCTLIHAILRRDFVVDVANDGREAIAKLTNRRYSVILIDLLMPIVDGFGVLDFLHHNDAQSLSSVIVITASSRRETERAGNYAVRCVIAKPFEVGVLLAAVKECAALNPPDPDR
jgi:putative two-component system response regulator